MIGLSRTAEMEHFIDGIWNPDGWNPGVDVHRLVLGMSYGSIENEALFMCGNVFSYSQQQQPGLQSARVQCAEEQVVACVVQTRELQKEATR